MKRRKIFAACVAGAMILSALPTGINAKAAIEIPEPIKTYSFDGSLDGSSACSSARGEYSGELSYTEGHEGGQAIQLDGYGLELNQKDLGEDHTISLWVQRTGHPRGNSSLVFMGAPANAQENWVSFSWVESTENMQIWTNGDGFAWTRAITDVDFPSDEWMMVTISQHGQDLSLYINGEMVGSGKAARSLVGSDREVCIGVTNWEGDATYPAIVDDINIYNKALNEDQVYLLYNSNPDVDAILKEKGIKVTDHLTLSEEENEQIQVDLPAGVQTEDVEITWQSGDETIASVDDKGMVTGKGKGSVKVTTVVKSKAGTKVEAETTIRVLGKEDENVVAFYDMDKISDHMIEDKSGLENNAAICNMEDVKVVEDGSRTVLELTGKGYVELPLSLYEDLEDKEAFTIRTTYARSDTSGTNAWLYCFGSKVQVTGSNYLFFCPNFGNTIRSGVKDAGTEKLFTTAVSQSVEEYYTIDMVFNHGKITMYQNGIEVGQVLDTGYNLEQIINAGTAEGVLGFIGRSCWSGDGYFNGKIDSFKVYNKAMTAEEIQLSNPSYLEGLQKELDKAVTEESLISELNPSLDEIRYDLNLPYKVGDLEINWSSDPKDIITQEGLVYNGAKDQKVKLTASVTSGVLTAEKSFDLTVKALDLSGLEARLEQAKNIDESLFTEESLNKYFNVIGEITLDGIQRQSETEEKIAKLNQALNLLEYKKNFTSPWDIINQAAPKEDVFCDAGYEEVLFTVPEEVADAVAVTYFSDNEEVAVYENGMMKALADGTAVVTVRVESKIDGYAMEYATLVTVGKEAGEENPGTGEPGGQNPDEENPDEQNPGSSQGSDVSKKPETGKGTRTPKTGDFADIWAYVATGILAMGAIGLVYKKRSKE